MRGAVARGVRRLRFTGGEPLVRRGFIDLLHKVGQPSRLRSRRNNGHDERRAARRLRSTVVRRRRSPRQRFRRPSLDRATFQRITRRDRLPQVLAGLDAAERVGLKLKINTLALKNDNAHELPELVKWAHGRGLT